MIRSKSCLLLLFILMCTLTACRRQGSEQIEVLLITTTGTTVPTEITEPKPPVPAATTQPAETETQPTQVCVPEPADEDFVKITEYIPMASQELFYATDRNFTGKTIYEFQDAYLRYGTVKKLMAVSEDLAQLGLRLKIWDGFRPVSAQFKLWEIYPDPTYVANPNAGYSSHSRGNTVDLTLVDETGAELEMPTGFDDFSRKADRDYSDCTETAANNAQILELLMEKHGFTGYAGEWWHYSDTVSYPVEQVFEP